MGDSPSICSLICEFFINLALTLATEQIKPYRLYILERRPRYRKVQSDLDLFKELNSRVAKRLEELPKSRLNMVKFNLFFLPFLYFSFYGLALFFAENLLLFLLFYALIGLMAVVIFCELIHELCHNNVFKSKKLNSVAFKLFDLLGANSFIWRWRHLQSHHRYPNVKGWDTDVEQKGPIAIFPEEEVDSFKKYQNAYVFFLYPLFMLNWLLLRDFKDYFSSDRIVGKNLSIPRIEYVKLFIFKFLYLFMMVGIPWLSGSVTLFESILGLLVLTFAGSIVAMLVLLTPHANVENAFPEPGRDGDFENSWFMHQLSTTNDLSTSNWFTRNFMGNFNYHLSHHLFPHVSSVYAPEVTEEIRGFLQEHNLPYKSYPIGVSLIKHFQLIKRNALAMR